MTELRRMIAELDTAVAHTRRASRALQEVPIDYLTARAELGYLLAAMTELRAIYDELGKPPLPPVASAA